MKILFFYFLLTGYINPCLWFRWR